MITISRCPCGHEMCRDWHVDGYAAVQGVKFSESEARAVAYILDPNRRKMLNDMARQHRGEEALEELHRTKIQLRNANETIRDLMTAKSASNVIEAEYALTGNPEDRELLTAIRKHARAKGWD